MSRRARVAWAAAGLAVFVVAGSWAPGRTRWVPLGAATMADPRLSAVRAALPAWREALRSTRAVVDVVCLVPDEATFLEAIAAWGGGPWFPILIDEPELTLRFLRAFRPARVARWPAVVASPTDRREAALRAVGRAWGGPVVASVGRANAIQSEGRGAPGVVLASDRAAALCGGVALAAGRRQPLVFWELEAEPGRVLTLPEALTACAQVAEILERVAGPQEGLGDGGDFLTLAGDWPDRYVIPTGDKAGEASLDDLLGRSPRTLERLAYTGRLTGPPARAVYQAMAALFLRPGSALLFNTYPERTPPWVEYRMDGAFRKLAAVMPTTLVQGGEADRAGWHRALDPVNRFGLVLINSSGASDQFRLRGGRGRTADVPPTGPAAVVAIHSFSAARPDDDATLAGRWLADGAFAYFGSMNEPYLSAFRTPELVAELLAAGAPLAAAVYKLPAEDATGSPWRLRLIGDPMYQAANGEAERPRRARLAALDGLEDVDGRGPDTGGPAARLRRCRDLAYADAARGGTGAAWAGELAAIERTALDAGDRATYDALLADRVERGQQAEAARRVPEAERAPALRRALEAIEARP
jgi:hypothetical protein